MKWAEKPNAGKDKSVFCIRSTIPLLRTAVGFLNTVAVTFQPNNLVHYTAGYYTRVERNAHVERTAHAGRYTRVERSVGLGSYKHVIRYTHAG